MLEYRFKYDVLYSQLVGNVCWTTLNFIFYEVKRADKTGSYSSKCGCTVRKTYSLPCARLISKKLELEKSIRMDGVFIHYTRLRFDDDGVTEDDKSNIYIMTE